MCQEHEVFIARFHISNENNIQFQIYNKIPFMLFEKEIHMFLEDYIHFTGKAHLCC